MSVDTHKFGMAHKGTSVVLYRSPAVRRHQFTQVRVLRVPCCAALSGTAGLPAVCLQA
jgi:glutamate/tyrosine decarboxylase-like PLP-dependent enzyme